MKLHKLHDVIKSVKTCVPKQLEYGLFLHGSLLFYLPASCFIQLSFLQFQVFGVCISPEVFSNSSLWFVQPLVRIHDSSNTYNRAIFVLPFAFVLVVHLSVKKSLCRLHLMHCCLQGNFWRCFLISVAYATKV